VSRTLDGLAVTNASTSSAHVQNVPAGVSADHVRRPLKGVVVLGAGGDFRARAGEALHAVARAAPSETPL